MNSYIFILFAISFLSWGIHVHSLPIQTLSMRQRYRQWMAEHNKIYTSSIDRYNRFQIFQKNARRIDAHNAAGNSTYTLGLNQFSDLTHEELVARFTGFRPRVRNVSANYKHQKVSLEQLPKSWDWRKKGAITPVKTQTCGNCWAFAGVAEVESVNFIGTGKLNVLSEQEVMDCDDLPGRGGCEGGYPQEVYEYTKHYGLTTEANYPTKPTNETCHKKGKSRVARVTSFVDMPSSTDEELMAAVVKQPVVVGINLSVGDYKSGVYTGECAPTNLNHVVQIVGFGETDDGLKYWILRNSWSAGWGEGGYVRIQRGTAQKEGLCGINLWPSYAIY